MKERKLKWTVLTLIFLSLISTEGQTVYGQHTTDTTCFLTPRAEFYVKHAELYFIELNSSQEKDTIINEQSHQFKIAESLINEMGENLNKEKRKVKWLIAGIIAELIAIVLILI